RRFYGNKFYDYPLKATNALRNLGIIEAVRCVLSYLWVRIHKPKDTTTFEGWTAARFGWRLYRTFFKTYTEKVWGVPATDIQADWAAQRIKNLSLGKAIFNALLPRRNQKDIASLIEEFQYPKYGPGMMWERCTELVRDQGSTVTLTTRVESITRGDQGAKSVSVRDAQGSQQYPCDHIISTMPINELLAVINPPAPPAVLAAAASLKHRDFLTVAIVVPQEFAFPDNWIYIHAPEVRVGRIQNFGSWSPYLVKEGRTCLGLEYFVSIGDDLWVMPDDDLVELAKREIATLGLADPTQVEAGFVVRMPKAYPVYDIDYQANVETIRTWLTQNMPNVHPVGRNGMHKYNNQDHSMYTAMLTVENIVDGTHHDIWAVNVEEEYHEEKSGDDKAGTGRDAPILPRSS
ncbi:MAG: NAD(P)/FAD-dependent oxidoreductase, partial [Acidimicrobiia bacterium]|nr:NAD(P)/FAD-dependent oxidoreductase [Acidimicrobiia bacterium]